jgi:2-isopropylmalate synthase
MRPEDIGISKSNLVLGKHSGRHAFRDRVKDLGFDLDDFEVNRAFHEFKKLADKKKDMYDGDIEAIIMNVDNASTGPWILKSLQITSGTDMDATAMLVLIDEKGDEIKKAATADGPVEAAFTALEDISGVDLTLKNFELHSATIGEDAQGEATVTVEYNENSYRGHGASQDIVEAASKAYLEVMLQATLIGRRSDNIILMPNISMLAKLGG